MWFSIFLFSCCCSECDLEYRPSYTEFVRLVGHSFQRAGVHKCEVYGREHEMQNINESADFKAIIRSAHYFIAQFNQTAWMPKNSFSLAFHSWAQSISIARRGILSLWSQFAIEPHSIKWSRRRYYAAMFWLEHCQIIDEFFNLISINFLARIQRDILLSKRDCGLCDCPKFVGSIYLRLNSIDLVSCANNNFEI